MRKFTNLNRIQFGGDRNSEKEIQHLVGLNSKLKKAINWNPSTSLEDGLSKK